MFKKVLAPLDGSLLAECVLAHVTSIAAACKAEVTLLQVVEAGSQVAKADSLAPPDPMAWQMRRVEARAYLDGARCRVAEMGVEAETVLLEGIVARRIVDHAEAENYDLVALSTHGRGGLEPWSAGSVAQKVMQGLRTSLLLVRAFEAQAPEARAWEGRIPLHRRILLALDGSQRAEAALPYATTLADRWGAELMLAHIVTRPACFRNAPCAGESAEIADLLVERNVLEAKDYLQRLQGRLGVRSRLRVAVGGNVMLALHELAEQEEVDLVVATAHGQGCNRRHRYGSVATGAILYGAAPLLVFQDMRPEQMEATAVERWVRASEDVGRWRPVGGRLKSSLRGVYMG